jgi:hypothetical protein
MDLKTAGSFIIIMDIHFTQAFRIGETGGHQKSDGFPDPSSESSKAGFQTPPALQVIKIH